MRPFLRLFTFPLLASYTGHLALENLHKLVLPFMLRRLKEDVMRDLPPKIIQDFACEMTSIQVSMVSVIELSNSMQFIWISVVVVNVLFSSLEPRGFSITVIECN